MIGSVSVGSDGNRTKGLVVWRCLGAQRRDRMHPIWGQSVRMVHVEAARRACMVGTGSSNRQVAVVQQRVRPAASSGRRAHWRAHAPGVKSGWWDTFVCRIASLSSQLDANSTTAQHTSVLCCHCCHCCAATGPISYRFCRVQIQLLKSCNFPPLPTSGP